MLLTVPGAVQATVATDKAALVALYNATDGANWTTKTNWTSEQPLASWHGVVTNSDGNVTSLTLDNNQLSGEIPAELGALSELYKLDLSANQLSGTIPATLGRLSNLDTLHLHTNDLSGAIPAELGALEALIALQLYTNQLSGAIPATLGRLEKLIYLDLSTNRLSGVIPAELGALSELYQLDLSTNQLSGAIPAELGALTALTSLDLHTNRLSGAIPAELGALTALTSLDLHTNRLSGAIPAELGALTALTRLYLDTNRLSGTIPAELGALTALTRLYLDTNRLSGTIPAELGALTALTRLDLHTNDLSGGIPAALGNLSDLTDLLLHNNALSGPIPTELGQLTQLTQLNLHTNGRYRNAALRGPLPASFTGLTALRELHAQHTQLTVPPALASWAAERAVTTGTAASSSTIPLDAANTAPVGVWTNATTLYVSDYFAGTVFAYTLADGSRDTAKDITLDSGNTPPQELWSNGTTLWVADLFGHKLYAYTLAGGIRDMDKDIALAATFPRGLWSDGTTVWVVDFRRNVYAYTLADGSRDMDKDFPSGLTAASSDPRGLWSDETTVWAIDATDALLYAYTLADGSHDAANYRVLDPANTAPWGVWSDGTTWYVTDTEDDVVYIYRNSEPEAVGTLPDLTLGLVGRDGDAQTIALAGAFRDPDGDVLQYGIRIDSVHPNEVVQAGELHEGLVTVYVVALGTTTATVTASDGRGGEATQEFTVTVVAEPLANQGPQAVGALPDLELGVYGTSWPVGVVGVFQDPDGDVLTYTAASSSPGVATVTVSGAEVTLVPVGGGRTTITVTATDGDGAGGTATQEFEVTVVGPPVTEPPVTEPPVTPRPPSGGGGGGGGGSGGSRDQHGDTAARATRLALGPPAWRSSTPGRLNTATDIDYFQFTLPQAGVLVVETTGSTDTVGTVWQDDVELATAASGGGRQNFRLSVRVEAGAVVLAVAGTGSRTGAYTLETYLLAGYLENPGRASLQSGIGVISGWTCEAEEVEIELNGALQHAAYGTERLDTAEVCGDTDNGFGLLVNWNRLGDGEHEVVAYVDDIEFGRVTVTVTTLGEEFLRDVAGTCAVADFPDSGQTVTVAWQQTQQNFVIARGPAPQGADRAGAPEVGYLENPGPNSFQSGIGVLSGWVCEGDEVVIELNGEPQPAAYGTERLDTLEVCGDVDNGFGLLVNWNRLGEGEHTVVAFVDGEELGRATVRVTTVGEGEEEEFLRDVEGECVVEDFPEMGQTVTLEWQQNSQNFVITDVE